MKLYQLLPYFSFRSLYSHPYIASANAPVRLHRRCLSTSGHRAALCIADVKSQAVSKQYQALIRYVNNPSVGFESFHCQPLWLKLPDIHSTAAQRWRPSNSAKTLLLLQLWITASMIVRCFIPLICPTAIRWLKSEQVHSKAVKQICKFISGIWQTTWTFLWQFTIRSKARTP